MNLFTRFLCSCAGCDISTLSQCNSAEQRKMAIIGSCVLITPMLGIVSGAFAMQILSKNLPLSIAFGLLWGYIILQIERAVVSNTRPGTFNLGVFARLLLAGVFATAIAVPMELRVFEDAIQEKLANNLSGIVKGVNADYDSQIAQVNGQLAIEKEKVDALRFSYIGEVDGTSGLGRSFRGKGPIALEKEKLWNQETRLYEKMRTDKQIQIDGLNKQRNEKISNISVTQAKGFLGQIRVLGELSKEDNTVFMGIWLIRLFFLSIELIPIFIKLSSGKNRDVYNEIAKQNGAMAISVNEQMETVKAEGMVKQQRAMVNKELLDLQFSEAKSVMDDALMRFDFYMAQLKKVSDKKLQMQQYIFKAVKDERFQNQMIDQIEKIYANFQTTLSYLMMQQQTGNNFNNNPG